MDITSPYSLIIISSLVLIISYLFGEISKQTSIPSVLLLIILGVAIKLGIDYMGLEYDFFPILEILGIVGLIMIVLEAALELKLDREKIVPITKAMGIALVGLLASTWVTAIILEFFIPELDTVRAWIYATPLSILSSAIVIPSVVDLRADKKEFHIYESTFSDIFGIMLFYFLLGQVGGGEHGDHGDGGMGTFALNTGITILLSLIFSYLIVIVFQNIKGSVKLFLLIATLLLLYAIGKMMHLSSLFIILIFGLTISNLELFFFKGIRTWLNKKAAHDIYHGLHVITMETAFVVRTFFFVIFGITIVFSSLADWSVIGVSALCLIVIYIIRFIILRIGIGKDHIPQLYIAPRGLITVLLFYAIPENAQIATFSPGILLFIIIGTSIIMTASMIYDKNRSQAAQKQVEQLPVKTARWKLPEGN